MASTSPSTGQASNNSTPALGAELSKVEARQAKNLWVTSRVIDGLMERIARAKRELEDAHVSTSVRASTTSSPLRTPSTTAKSPSGKEKDSTGGDEKTRQKMDVEEGLGGGAVAVLSQLSKDVEGMKPLDSVGSEHKNFHATISKLAKAAEKVCMCWGKAVVGESSFRLVYQLLDRNSKLRLSRKLSTTYLVEITICSRHPAYSTIATMAAIRVQR